MIALPVHIIVFIMMWRLDPNVCTINTTNHRQKASLQKKVVFDFLDLVVQRWPFYELIPPSVQCQRYISDGSGHRRFVYAETSVDYCQMQRILRQRGLAAVAQVHDLVG